MPIPARILVHAAFLVIAAGCIPAQGIGQQDAGTGGAPGGNGDGGTGAVPGTGGQTGVPGSGGAVGTGGQSATGGAGSGGRSGSGGAASGGAGGTSGGTGGRGGSGTGGRGGSGTGGMATGGRGGAPATGGQGGSMVVVDCSAVARPPASVETLTGFVSSEDFVFDNDGNYVGVDDNENLVRIGQDKRKKLWVPALGDIAGMAMLPDGSLVFSNVGKGSLQRVQSNGSVTTILGGLLYPNGLCLGPDGFVYVAENAAGRVRRVNPDNGEFTVVAMGLQGPNGVALGTDAGTLYVGSFEGSGVYRVKMPMPGQLGQASVFARPNGSQLKEPMLACPAMREGEACSVPGQFTGGTCRRIANVIDCVKDVTIGPCDGDGCTSSQFGGGIDGLGVDACGNVYATEYRYSNLWRISPEGKIEQLAKLNAMWIPNLKWGRGVGLFKTDVLYVADRDQGRLFAVSVGVPAASILFGGQP
jgi:sugar lactone lactonase YvrE